jgi:hypothetical protein
VYESSDERSDAGDRAAHDWVAAAGELTGVRKGPSEYAIEIAAPIEVASPATNAACGCACERDAEDRCKGRKRAVDQPDHRRLDALEQECVFRSLVGMPNGCRS